MKEDPDVVSQRTELSKPALVGAVARRGGPRLVEAMVIPAVLFYASLVLGGVGVAYVRALAWSYSTIGFRALTGRPVYAVHGLVSVGLTVKTSMAVATGSTFVNFAGAACCGLGGVGARGLGIDRPRGPSLKWQGG